MESTTQKEISPTCANNINFVKPSHSDLKDTDKLNVKLFQCCVFDPRLPQHRSLIWHLQIYTQLWHHVICNHENTAMIQRSFFTPSVQQCFKYINSMMFSQSEANSIEIATRGQASSKLWMALHNGRITSSRFGEILHRKESTNPQNLVKIIMGYGKHQTKHIPPQVQWGQDNEPVACKCYLKNRQRAGEIMLFEPTGLFFQRTCT